MPNQNDNVFQFAPLNQYSIKDRILIRIADIVFYGFIRVLGSLTRFEERGTEHLEAIEAAGKLPVYSLWHDRIFLGTYYLRDRGLVVMTSQSFDGEYIARFIQRLGFGAIRGSSTRGGARAFVAMIKSMNNRHPMAFTVDGPRGPRYEAKPGPVLLAKKTGNPILPYVVQPRHFWSLNSWDRMQIPHPFSSALVIYGEPIYVDASAGEADIRAALAKLQQSLDALNQQCETWRSV